MSDREARQLERSLRAEGRLEDVVWEILDRTDDPKLIAMVVDKFSNKLTVPSGNLLILSTDPPEVTIPPLPLSTHRVPIMVPRFEGARGTIFCFRIMIVSSGKIAWSLGPRREGLGGRIVSDPKEWPEGPLTIPFAADPFELQQATVWELDLESLSPEPVTVTFSMFCRVQRTPCQQCEGWGVIGPDGRPCSGGPGSVSIPCPACRPEAHESYRFHAHLEGLEAIRLEREARRQEIS